MKHVFYITPFGEVDGHLFNVVFDLLFCNRINFVVLDEYHFALDSFDTVIKELKCPAVYESESSARSVLGDSLVDSILFSVSNHEL